MRTQLEKSSAFFWCRSLLVACLALGEASFASAQTITSIEIVGQDTLNSHGTLLSTPYVVHAVYSNGLRVPVTDAILSTSESQGGLLRPGNRILALSSGVVTLNAWYPGNPDVLRASKNVQIVGNVPATGSFDLNCANDAPVGANFTLQQFAMGAVNDLIPHCGPQIIVAHNALNSVQVVDILAGVVLRSWQLPSTPASMVRVPGTHYLFVALTGSQLARINMETHVIDYVPLGGSGVKVFLGEPGEVWVKHSQLSRFDAATLSPLGGSTPMSDYARYFSYLPSTKALFVANAGLSPSSLTRYSYNPVSGAFTPAQSVSTGSNGQDLDVSSDGKRLAAVSGAGMVGYTIADLNPANLTQLQGTWNTGAYPSAARFRFDSKKLLGSNGTNLMIFDVATHTSEISVGADYCQYADVHGVRWSPSARNAFMLVRCGADHNYEVLAFLAYPAPHVLTVVKSGSGDGMIVSATGGISCGDDCWDTELPGTSVTLTATPGEGSVFGGWSGASCSGGNNEPTCTFALNAATTVTAAFVSSTLTRLDFNDDSRADILLRNTSTGENYLYPMNGTAILAGEGYIRTVPSPWNIAGLGDFDGNGTTDILLRNSSTGENYVYFMNGTTIASEGYIRTVPLAWSVAGVADLDGDGKADILLRNTTTGENYLYPMDGLTIKGTEGYIRTVPSPWAIAGLADLNNDGRADILLRNTTTGENYLYPMNGTAILAGEGYIRTVASPWTLAGIGDFDGNGTADLFWRNTSTGENYFYFMNGTAITSEGYVRTVPLAWSVASIADFNGDGRADILLRNTTTGENYLYPMNGTAILGTEGYVRTVPTSWSIVSK
jgi:hypothetical protein